VLCCSCFGFFSYTRFFSLRLSLASCSGKLTSLSTPRGGFSFCLLSSPLLKQQLAVLYFKVISSNFISCSKKFLPESAIDVITTSTWFHSSYSVLATVSSPS
ncbi:hypothetical protein LDENG_00293060, partial [Lucifuga dentata]